MTVTVRTNTQEGAARTAPLPLTSIRPLPRHALRLVVAILCALLLASGMVPRTARAEADGRPSVLVVDSNLGDAERLTVRWLGPDAEPVAEDGGRVVTSCPSPAWWTSGEDAAPATFVLSRTKGALTADDIAWALDAIRASGAEPRTFVVAMGTAGLPVRSYAEGLASQRERDRADLVGLAFCGTPHNGYSASGTYGECALWERLAASVGLTAADLDPTSPYLAELNAGALPAVCRSLVLVGSVGDLGFGLTDGAALAADLTPAESLSTQVEVAQVDATISQETNLTGAWQPLTSSIDYGDRAVDAKLTELLSAKECYATAPDVQAKVREFYASWFGEQAPVTHNSNVLLLDLSGSMRERIDDTNDKLTAAKEAAKEYLGAMRAVSELPQSAPMDVAVIGFGEQSQDIARSYDQAACDGIDAMMPLGETNIGVALEAALASLKSSPSCATRHILLLSDGASTRGMSEAEMLDGPIARAHAAGIVIDTIGFGDVGESDAAFLKKVAKATDGTYYLASDTYTLKVNFLKAYYGSLGLPLVDEELGSGKGVTEALGTIDQRTTALLVGVVAQQGTPAVTPSCGGTPLDETLYATSDGNGLTSLQCLNPPAGEYALEISGASGAAHVFAVRQQGISHVRAAVAQQRDYSLYLILGAAALLVAGIVAVVAHTLRSRRGPQGPAGGATRAVAFEPPAAPEPPAMPEVAPFALAGDGDAMAPVGPGPYAADEDGGAEGGTAATVVSWDENSTIFENGNAR